MPDDCAGDFVPLVRQYGYSGGEKGRFPAEAQPETYLAGLPGDKSTCVEVKFCGRHDVQVFVQATYCKRVFFCAKKCNISLF